jgi:AraC-like DNA-binding protein
VTSVSGGRTLAPVTGLVRGPDQRERILRRCSERRSSTAGAPAPRPEPLLDPAHRHRSVAEIAESYGFTEARRFSRAFRRVMGATAREVRALAARGEFPSARSAGAGEWWQWIERMR